MKIVCVGGGPSGLYFATSAKLRDPRHDITVVERNAAGETYGWGVVFWDDLLDSLHRNDPVSARRIRADAALWQEQEVHLGGARTAYLGGYGFSMGRRRLLDILAGRARELGVDVRFRHEIHDLAEFADADLIVAGDGVNSRVRQLAAGHFRTTVDVGRNKYIWLGTHRVFDAFTFAFEQTPAGWIWFHAYRFDAHTSTFIVECSPETWAGLGLDTLGPEATTGLLETIFSRHLDGHPLIIQTAGAGQTPWLEFRRVVNESWRHGNVVLMGDAAHTTHFAIGSGTKLALLDAIELAEQLDRHDDTGVALAAYEDSRRTALRALQDEAHHSTLWFENIHRHIDEDPVQFAYALWKRRGDYPGWRYRLHLATQIAAVRRLRRWYSSARRFLRARRRRSAVGAQQAAGASHAAARG